MGRILLIEDEQGAQFLFKNRLEELRHEVVVTPTGARGLMEARAQRFDLFLIDVVLGSGIDGYEVCRRLKAMPQMHGIPVVLVSGQLRNRDDLHRGYEAGCDAFLIKGDLPLLEDVVRAMLNIKNLQDDLGMQNRLLEEQNRRLQEERQRGADLEVALRETGNRSLVFRELAAGRPDGMLLVDSHGIVRYADRGALDILGKDLAGRNLGSLAPASGLEAFVRDARTEPREGFRFDLSIHGGKATRSLSASVMPMVPLSGGTSDSGLHAVLLLDAGKRQVAAEMLRMQEQGVPRRELGPLLEAARIAFHPSALLGRSARMGELRRQVSRLSKEESGVLICGAPGTGKELVARALHFGSNRSGAFVPVNCAALAPAILEAELFGHVKGAFPGAVSDRPGLCHQAHLGTLFLDEITEMPSELQARLVHVLTEREVHRVGTPKGEHVDVRIIASTSADADGALAQGRLNRHLHHQLAAAEIRVPALKDRPGDVAYLAERFFRRYGADREALAFDDRALWIMESYPWPGNVRELENCVERFCTLIEGTTIGVEDLPQSLRDHTRQMQEEIPPARRRQVGIPGTHVAPSRSAFASSPPAPGGEVEAVPISLKAYEKRCIEEALERTGGDKLKAAKLLNVGKSTLYRKLKSHGIS